MGYIENCFFGFYNVKNNRCAVSLCSRDNRLVQLTKYCENGKKISWQNTVLFFFFILSTLLAIQAFARQVYIMHLLFFFNWCPFVIYQWKHNNSPGKTKMNRKWKKIKWNKTRKKENKVKKAASVWIHFTNTCENYWQWWNELFNLLWEKREENKIERKKRKEK